MAKLRHRNRGPVVRYAPPILEVVGRYVWSDLFDRFLDLADYPGLPAGARQAYRHFVSCTYRHELLFVPDRAFHTPLITQKIDQPILIGEHP